MYNLTTRLLPRPANPAITITWKRSQTIISNRLFSALKNLIAIWRANRAKCWTRDLVLPVLVRNRVLSPGQPCEPASSPTPHRCGTPHHHPPHVCAVHGNEPSPSASPASTSTGSDTTSFTLSRTTAAPLKAAPDHSRVLYYFYHGN